MPQFTFRVVGPAGDVRVEVATAKDAAELLRFVVNPDADVPYPDREDGPKDRDLARQICRELSAASDRGISANELAKRLGYGGPQGLRWVGDALERVAEFDLYMQDVRAIDFVDRRKVNGVMRWFPGNRLPFFRIKLGLLDPSRASEVGEVDPETVKGGGDDPET